MIASALGLLAGLTIGGGVAAAVIRLIEGKGWLG